MAVFGLYSTSLCTIDGDSMSKATNPKISNENVKANAGAKSVSKELLMKLYREMLLIRRFEEKAGQLYGMGLIGGFCHLYIGQEAVVSGMQDCITPNDAVITSYRDHAHMLACGMDPKGIMAELTGRIGGFSKGKGGSMHMFSTEKHFYGGHGIVGAQVPLGTGIAFAHKYRNNGALSLVYFGDGSVNQGQVYEAFNMASLWKLPVIYIIENNEYAMGTSVKRSHSTTELFRRGEGFAIPGKQVDGMDVIAVREAGQEAVKHVREGNGPFLLEMKTYRYRGHSMSDPAKYRSKEEVEGYKEHHDPIEGLKARMSKEGITEDALKTIEKEIKNIVAEAADFAQKSPEPPESELWTDVLV
jgi:pyruvate dehydrogenase E1 component alpha subunit